MRECSIRCVPYLAEKNAQVVLMPGAREVLAWADEVGFSSLSILIRGQCFYHSK